MLSSQAGTRGSSICNLQKFPRKCSLICEHSVKRVHRIPGDGPVHQRTFGHVDIWTCGQNSCYLSIKHVYIRMRCLNVNSHLIFFLTKTKVSVVCRFFTSPQRRSFSQTESGAQRHGQWRRGVTSLCRWKNCLCADYLRRRLERETEKQVKEV